MKTNDKELRKQRMCLVTSKFWNVICEGAIKVARFALKRQRILNNKAQAAYNRHLFNNCTPEQKEQIAKIMEEA